MRWMRLRRAFAWGLRGLAAGLALALTIGLPGLLAARLPRLEFLALVGAFALAAPLLAGAIAYLWPMDALRAARYFDRAFRLDERVSTALEADPEARRASRLLQQQLEDALAAARLVRPRRQLPLRLGRVEGLLTLALALALGLLWFRGEPWFQAANQRRAVQQAVQAQAEQIEEILSQIRENEALTPEQQSALSRPLEQALTDLQGNPSLEGSVSVLTNSGEELQALSDPQARQMAEGLRQAGEQLATQEGSPLQTVGQSLAEGNTVGAAAQLENLDLEALDPAEAQQTAEQLQQLADSLAASNPELAAQLGQAAQALQNGDVAAAQEALDQAAASMAQAGQQVIFSETAEQAGQQLQQGAAQVLAAGGGQQGAQAGQGSAGEGQSGQTDGEGAAGSGSGHGTGSTSPGGEAGSSPIPQDNGPGEGGETAYEQIYAPSLVGGEGGPEVGLPGSSEDGTVMGEGPSAAANPGESLVPYQEVYSEYEQLNQQAIENGSVPLAFIEIIRSYFNSLRP